MNDECAEPYWSIWTGLFGGLRLINSMSPIPLETFESKFRIIQTDFALQPTLLPNGRRRSRTAHVIGRTAPQNYTLLLRCHRSKGGTPPRVESDSNPCGMLYRVRIVRMSVWELMPGAFGLDSRRRCGATGGMRER